MDESQLKKYKKRELISQLMEKRQHCEELEKELECQQEQKPLPMGETGSLSYAALQLSGIFEAADEAAMRFLESLSAGANSEDEKKICEMYQKIKAQRCSNAFETYEEIEIEKARQRVAQYEERLKADVRKRMTELETEILVKIREGVSDYSEKIKAKLRADAQEYKNSLLEEIEQECEQKLRQAELEAGQIISRADEHSQQTYRSTQKKCREREFQMEEKLADYGRKIREFREMYTTLLEYLDKVSDGEENYNIEV